MLDIHAHLYWNSYDADRDEVVKRAFQAGVEKMICVGTAPEDNLQALAVAERYEHVSAAVGLHPHFFNELVEKKSPITKIQDTKNHQLPIINFQNTISELKKIVQSSKKVVAIGECGLDYYSHDKQITISSQQKTVQREGFLAQIALAGELGLPMIIHTRPSFGAMDAYEDLYEIIQNTKYKIRHTILHCYMGDTAVTAKFLELPNVYFSFAGNITYPVKKALLGTKDDLTETVKMIPLERLFVETDCPFLAPQSQRGKRNEPAYVHETTEFLAHVRGVSADEIGQITAENGGRVFWPSLPRE